MTSTLITWGNLNSLLIHSSVSSWYYYSYCCSYCCWFPYCYCYSVIYVILQFWVKIKQAMMTLVNLELHITIFKAELDILSYIAWEQFMKWYRL